MPSDRSCGISFSVRHALLISETVQRYKIFGNEDNRSAEI
nr:MAG TPA: hypothetical protein [Caudoviricetes sp.]